MAFEVRSHRKCGIAYRDVCPKMTVVVITIIATVQAEVVVVVAGSLRP